MARVEATFLLWGFPKGEMEPHRAAIIAALSASGYEVESLTWDPSNSLPIKVDAAYDDHSAPDMGEISQVIKIVKSALPLGMVEELPMLVIQDGVLGELEYDDEFRHWYGKLVDEMQLFIQADDPTLDIEPQLAKARDIATNLAHYDAQWRAIIVRDMLDNYNQNWSRGRILTAEQFNGEIQLTSITVKPDLHLRLIYFAESELFWEHDIELTIELDGTAFVGLIG